MDQKLIELMADLKESETAARVQELLEAKTDPLEILAAARAAMEVVGKRFETSEYFIPDLVMAGEILTAISNAVKPLLTKGEEGPKKGKVLIATVEGDIHDIGKDIVGFMLEVNGFEVYDLGIDQPEEAFVKAVQEHKPQVLALSGFLSVAFDSMRSTIEQVEGAGLRPGLKVIIGGGQMDDTVRKYTGADAYGDDAMAAVAFAKEAVGVK
jgi:5-methyltetrahydrofolate--homocysteine methyltransferase